MRYPFFARCLLLILAIGGLACAGFQAGDLFDHLNTEAPLSEATVADGLKEALRVGTQRAASALSQPGGFSDNPLLRLAIPKELDRLADALRTVGLGGQVDALEATMNRAAERAAGEAVPVFASAIASMTVQDAFGILNGPENAATEYFRVQTSDALRARFSPVVSDAMREVGLYRAYRDVVTKYEALPFSKPVAPDLETYVADHALLSLFQTLSEEEGRIREDPAARTTHLLRRVFGSIQ